MQKVKDFVFLHSVKGNSVKNKGVVKKDFRVRKLQKEIKIWEFHNFGINTPERCLLGIVEEIEEFFAARSEGNVTETKDALGDIMIFTINYCTALRLDAQLLWDISLKGDMASLGSNYAEYQMALRIIGNLSHSTLKLQQCIRGNNEMHMQTIHNNLNSLLRFVRLLHKSYSGSHVDLISCTLDVWKNVKTRDWRKQC